MEFKLIIALGNDAMRSPEDVAQALRKIASDLEDEGGEPWDGGEDEERSYSDAGAPATEGVVMDLNGNRVGTWKVA